MQYKSCRKALLSLAMLLLIASVALGQSAAPQAKKKPSASSKPAPAAPKLQLDPKALEILKASSDRLASAHTLSFTAVELFEHPTRQGAPLGYTTKYEVTLQRPDKLRVLKLGDGPANSFYYDGKSMMGYAPAENLLAVADAPPTIDATLEKAYKLAGIYVPFDDLIVADPYGDLAPGLMHAYYVGQSHVVAGITTDIVAYAGDGVLYRPGLERRTSCRGWFARFTWMIPTSCVTNSRSRTGSWTRQCQRTRSRRPAQQRQQSIFRSPMPARRYRRTPNLQPRPRQPSHSNKE